MLQYTCVRSVWWPRDVNKVQLPKISEIFVFMKCLRWDRKIRSINLIYWCFVAAPSINIAPPPNIEVEVGGYFTIICEAVGTPTPLIVWRLNWGNIPSGDRVYVSSINGRGNLTITDARVEDSGAYTCEAINVKGSIFASPDAIIIVRRKCY